MSLPTNPNPFAASSPETYPTGGYPPANPNQTPMMLAVGSLITGLIGTIACGCCIFLPMPLLSIVLGAAALLNKPDKNAKVMAIIGIVLGALTLLTFLGAQAFLMINAAARN